MLNGEQIAFYREQGYLHIPSVYTSSETQALSDDLDWIIKTWADEGPGWVGPWRRAYMDEETEKKSKLIALHDLQLYSAAWMRAVTHPRVAAAMADLLGPEVEFHHSTLHVKPPETGHPFPMHQDHPFYPHQDGRYVDVLVHLDDTRHENGEIRFLPGSHKDGPIEHITKDEQGNFSSPHLPMDKYKLEDTVPVPALRGDLVIFSIYTIHGSYINTTDQLRRLVRVGYRHPDNRQVGGQSHGRPGWLIHGRRSRTEGMTPYPQG
jgi:phytanoyl-CoA hydroxylase